VSELFDELDVLTKDAFANLKDEMDTYFAKRYKTEKEKLMPWHYQGRFFQESPQIYPLELDKYYSGKNLEELTKSYYLGIGLDVEQIMANSDLYEKPGKNQHAYCIDIDSEGDIRVLCNIKDNEQWMGTMLHEFGHAVYAQGHDNPANPYFLREAAHSFTTEAVAMLFGRLSRNPEWMSQMLELPLSEMDKIQDDCHKSSRLQQLVFSRWAQVMYRFEKEMYANPNQDLNELWWTLVSKYQMLTKPEGRNEPDWATKIHVALYPCYYHNYQLGELLASQFHYYIVNNITKSGNIKNDSYIGNKEVGDWIREKVFEPGMKHKWNDMIEAATGEKLTAKYYASQFVD
jgi:peptidyl-dipeptidase A